MSKSLPDALDLPKPKLLEADENGSVDSLKLLNGGNVSVRYNGMQKKDLIALDWPLAGSPYPPIESQHGDDAGCINFHIPSEYIALWLDNFAVFTYTVTRNDESQTSLQGMVRISLPSNLPQVQILEAIDGKLDLSLLCCKDPILYIPPWAFAGTIQTINCYISGIYPDGSKARLYPFEVEPVTDEDVRLGWRRALPRALLQQLKHDSELHLVAFVRFSLATPTRQFRSLLLTLLTEPHLELSPPELKEAVHTEFDGWVVNPINTVNGAHIAVAYEGMCSGDMVCPTLTGTPGPGTVVLECRQPAEGETSLVFAVPPSVIRANFEQAITLTYNVTRCDGSHSSSPERRVKVLGIMDLPKPGIEQATGNRVDLNTFGDDATAIVPIWHYAMEQDCCWMWVTGTLEAGNAYQFYILEGEPLITAWLGDGVDTPIARTKLQKLADCSEFELHFAANFNGLCDLGTAVEFPVRTFSIEQEALVLVEPTVTEAVLTNLTAYNGRDGVHVEVKYAGSNPKHSISVCWKRPDDTCWLLPSKPGSTTDAVIWLLPPEAVIESMGKVVEITYTVTTACKVQTSPPLNLSISLPVRLETPNLRQATPPRTQNGIVDTQTFAGNADAFIDWMWFLRAGHKCWLRATGIDKSGAPYSFVVYAARTITAAEEAAASEVAATVLRSELVKAQNQSSITFTWSVSTDGLTENVVCPPRVLTVVTPPEIRYENFTGQATKLISAGQSISIPTMTIAFISGPGQAGISPYSSPVPGMLEGQALVTANRVAQTSSPQLLRLTLTFNCKRVRFAYTGKNYPTMITFYSPEGGYLGAVSLNGPSLNGWVDFSATGSSIIGRIDISSSDWTYWDFFTFWL
ncbi:hypothetical protein [Pseudomonas sp. R2-60-08W]|uniref:hypothetical protein n=1 Tax=Pseudomonas sp. R2-60-08W TaxID=1173280 RepID=UPI000F57ECC2|nr:hypothetical protein [Pseudomonas sp. R2-60-08W]AZF27804.1 hypothetical protein C4J90_3648 [Pseudomonas sp. R2-60-08W]